MKNLVIIYRKNKGTQEDLDNYKAVLDASQFLQRQAVAVEVMELNHDEMMHPSLADYTAELVLKHKALTKIAIVAINTELPEESGTALLLQQSIDDAQKVVSSALIETITPSRKVAVSITQPKSVLQRPDYVMQIGSHVGFLERAPSTKAELVERLKQAADFVDWGYTAKGYAYSILTFGVASRLTGTTRIARQLRALAKAIENDNEFENDLNSSTESGNDNEFENDPNNSAESEDYEKNRVRYYINKQYGKAELQRKRTILPLLTANEKISMANVVFDSPFSVLGLFFGRKRYLTDLQRKIGLIPNDKSIQRMVGKKA